MKRQEWLQGLAGGGPGPGGGGRVVAPGDPAT